jgi:protein TonB
MRKELELLELVDRYLDGGLNDAERAAFEQRLADNADLRTMLEDQRMLREGIARMALRPAVAKAYRAHRFGKWKPWLGGAGTVVMIAAAGWALWDRMPQEAHERPVIEHVDSLHVEPASDTCADTMQGTIQYKVDTIVDTVYKVFQNGRWRTVKERPEGTQVMADSAVSHSPSTARESNELVVDINGGRTPLPVRMEPVETKPEYPGGMKAFYDYLEANIRHPDLTKPVSGTVQVGFTINAQGRVEDAAIVKGLNEAYNAEALRVIRSMPRWKPGEENGKPVPCRLQMPMEFRNPGAPAPEIMK